MTIPGHAPRPTTPPDPHHRHIAPLHRDAGLERVSQLTKWTVAGGLVLTGGFVIAAPGAHGGHAKATSVATTVTVPAAAPVTVPPTTAAPTTAPTTASPVTSPSTAAPAAGASGRPTTPVTAAPVTVPPTTTAPVTAPPTTAAPRPAATQPVYTPAPPVVATGGS